MMTHREMLQAVAKAVRDDQTPIDPAAMKTNTEYRGAPCVSGIKAMLVGFGLIKRSEIDFDGVWCETADRIYTELHKSGAQ